MSYLTHDGRRDPAEDVALCDRLLAAGHMSPFEHVARPMTKYEQETYMTFKVEGQPGEQRIVEAGSFCGNFRGWVQFRKLLPNEHDILGAR